MFSIDRLAHQILDSDLIGLCISTSDGLVIDANNYYLNLLGVSREQMLAGKVNWKDYTDAMHMDRSIEAARELFETGYTHAFEKDYINARGERVSVLVRASRLDESTHMAFILDLSQSKLGERLSQSEQFLESVVEHIPNMIFVKDAKDLRFVRFNKAGEELVGHPRATLIGKSDRDFFPPDQADYFIAKDREVIKTKAVVDIPEEPIETANGTRYLHTKKIPVFDKDGNPQYLVGISEDITERKIAEQQKIALVQAEAARQQAEKSAEEMALLNEKANEANRAKSAFLANISHELRTPLGAMLGFAELALDSATDGAAAEYVQTILRNGKELLRIVNEVLDISKAESNSMEIEKFQFSLPDFLKDIHQLMIIRAKQKNLELKFLAPKPLPNFVYSDPYRLRQILLNVVGNAIKFTEHGSVTIETTQESDLVKFTISDTGIGIDPIQAEKLFKPFAQADDSMTRKFGGTGLGLYLSRRLARLLGGDVKILQSTCGRGSLFEVSVRMHLNQAVLNGHETLKSSTAVQEVSVPTGGKILVVDDSKDNQELIAAYLKTAKIECELASRGREAVELANDSYRAILMDIQMPEMDGFEALKQIREKGVDIPVIALTAHAMKGDRERCMQAGFDDYLSKPLARKDLMTCISRHYH